MVLSEASDEALVSFIASLGSGSLVLAGVRDEASSVQDEAAEFRFHALVSVVKPLAGHGRGRSENIRA